MPIDITTLAEKWQKKRTEAKIYQTLESKDKPKFYILDMFPYPSGAGLHVGHPKGYVASDTIARKKMLEGYNVLHPMGFDTFGVGTEQYAIEHKMKPQIVAQKNIETYIKQLENIGFSYDRERSFSTADPKYFKWTQAIFLKFYNHYYDEKEEKAKPITELEEKLKKKENLNQKSGLFWITKGLLTWILSQSTDVHTVKQDFLTRIWMMVNVKDVEAK